MPNEMEVRGPADAAQPPEGDDRDGGGDPEMESPEARGLRGRAAPRAPSPQEVEEHWQNGHYPRRRWCKCCLAAGAIASPHVQSGEEDQRPVVSMDYCYPDSSVDAETRRLQKIEQRRSEGLEPVEDVVPENANPVLVIYESLKGNLFALENRGKGATHVAVAKAVEALDAMGYPEVTLKSDQEPSILSLKAAIKARWPGDAVFEESPAYDPRANGAGERAVRSLKEQRMVMRLALQERIGEKVPDKHPLLSWITAYAATRLRRGRVGADGRTPFERIKGKRSLRPSRIRRGRHGRPAHAPALGTWRARVGRHVPWCEGSFR